jgi:hypothetical protein
VPENPNTYEITNVAAGRVKRDAGTAPVSADLF